VTVRKTSQSTKQRPPSSKQLARVQLVVFDFDGVMTDNRVMVMQDGTEGVFCNRSDGLGIGLARDAGLEMMVLSKEENPVVSARCRKLKLQCLQGVDDKIGALTRVLRERGIDASRVVYVGNDVNDLACMNHVGIPVAVQDAYPQVLKVARWITRCNGGHGAVREVCDALVNARVS